MRSFSITLLLGALGATSPLTGQAVPLTVADLTPGDLVVTEYLANPVGVADTAGEYFELLNRRNTAVDLAGLIIRDDGSNQFTVTALTLDPGAFGVLGNGDGSALGFAMDYIYGSSMSLTNSADQIVLVGAGDQELFRLDYADGDVHGAGVASELISLGSGLTTATDADYQAATQSLLLGNQGSPGSAGGTSIPTVPVPAAGWLLATALAMLAGLRRRLVPAPAIAHQSV